MHRRSLILVALLLALAVPLSASQFVQQPFDEVAREAGYVVRAHVVDTFSAWDSAHEVIYTYATVRVQRYIGETTGPDTLVVREVGGTVDGYTQEAIGFPMIRQGEQVVLFLSLWEDGADYRIHGFNQGKFLVRNRGGAEILVEDPVKQGDARMTRDGRFAIEPNSDTGLRMDEFVSMVDDARAGVTGTNRRQRD
jgi:hypothetical protein